MNVISLASELVRIPSINAAGQDRVEAPFGEAQMAACVETLLRQIGAQTTVTYPLPGRPNVTGFFDAGANDTIIFEAHLDTVAVEGMTVSPFGGEIKNNCLWGRGACDVKGPMAAMLSALQQSAGSLKRNVLFAAVCDEESGFAGVRHFLKTMDNNLRERTVFAVIAEPTDLQPVAAHKGVVRWRITARGIAAHSSAPELGDNAIYRMADVVTTLRRHATLISQREPHAHLGTPTLSVGIIQGGSAVNIVPDSCYVDVDRRLVPGESPESALDELVNLLGPGNDLEISVPVVAAPAFEIAPDSPAIQLAVRAANAAGRTSAPQYAKYCTDASFYPSAGIPAFVFGPGSILQAHTKDEWISLSELEAGVMAYRYLLEN